MAENQLPMVSWDRFQPTGGQYDSSWVSPLASAGIEAAKLAANPITRAFEQMMDRRFTEQQARADMEFRGMQAQRNREDAIMLAREGDAARLKEVEAKLAAEDRRIQAAADEERRAAETAARLLFGGAGPTAPVDGGYTPGSTMEPGTGPLRWDAGAFMPAAPGPRAISPADAGALGISGVATVSDDWRMQDTEAAKAKAAAAAAAAEAANANVLRQQFVNDDQLSDAEVRRLTALSYSNPTEAAAEYNRIMGDKRDEAAKAAAAKAEAAAKKEAEKATGVFTRKFPGIPEYEYPVGLRDKPMAGVTDISKMEAGERSALWNAARKSISDDRTLMGSIIQADAMGAFKPGDPNFGVSENLQRLRANEIAEQLGWKREDIDETGAYRQKTEAPAPAAAASAPTGKFREALVGATMDTLSSPETAAFIREARKAGFFNKDTAKELREFYSRTPEERAVFFQTGEYPAKRASEEARNAAKRGWIDTIQSGLPK